MRNSTREALAPPDPEIGPAANPAAPLAPRARAGLVILGILTLVWIFQMPAIDPRGKAQAPRFEALGTRLDSYAITGLRVEALDRDVPVFEPSRNIFEFASMVDARRPGEQSLRQRELAKGGTKRARPTPNPDPALDVDVLGVFGPQRLRIAVLRDQSGDGVTNLLEREVIENRYRVLEIDSTSILLRDTAAPDAAPIRLELPGGNRHSGL